MNTPRGYVDPEYLRIAGEKLKDLKLRTYQTMRISPGDRVLDVGCGPGTDTIPLAGIVGSSGMVYGVDYDEAMIAEADRNARESGVSGRVIHRHADASSLPFENGYFDSCRSERLFQHLLDPAAALAEMTRVTRLGGWIVVLDTDWASGGMDTPEIEVERRLVQFNAEQMFHNGYAGRQLYRLFRVQGLLDVSCEAFTITVTNYAFARQIWTLDRLEQAALAEGVISRSDLQRLQTSFERAEAQGMFFGYGSMMLVTGRRGG